MEINITPEQINEMIREAVMNSSIGAVIKDQVKSAVDGLSSHYNNPIEEAAKKEILHIIVEIMRSPEMHEKIKSLVINSMTDEFISQITNSAFRELYLKTYGK